MNVATRVIPWRPSDSGGALGRHVEHDPRSRMFAVSAPSSAVFPATKVWKRFGPVLNQGDVGACTGYAMAGWLDSAPYRKNASRPQAVGLPLRLYRMATQLDTFPGEYPPDDTGSSGLAVAKAAKKLGLLPWYSWAFSTTAIKAALQTAPVIIGIPWYEGMDTPSAEGLVAATGEVRGGHEVLVRGYDRSGLVCDNSWGVDWGLNGSFHIPMATWEVLRKQGADVVCPMARTW